MMKHRLLIAAVWFMCLVAPVDAAKEWQEMKGQKAGERVRFDDLDGGVAGGDMGDGTERRTLADTISDEWAAAENMDRELDAETVQKLAKEVLRPTVYAACYHPELVASKNTRSHYRAEGVRLIREALAA